MKSKWLPAKLNYTGEQLHSLYSYLNHKLLGDSVLAFRGKCSVSFEHMVDGEDLLEQSAIAGDDMLHFIIEYFQSDLFSAVAVQRLFASIVKDQMDSALGGRRLGPSTSGPVSGTVRVLREGDDLYFNGGKLSISIATRSPVSNLIHFAVNVTNQGTPVKTASLFDLGYKEPDVAAFAEAVMKTFCQEFDSIQVATQKVRPVS